MNNPEAACRKIKPDVLVYTLTHAKNGLCPLTGLTEKSEVNAKAD